MGAFVAGYRFRDCDEIVVEGVRLYLEGDKGDKDEAPPAGAKQRVVDMMRGKVMLGLAVGACGMRLGLAAGLGLLYGSIAATTAPTVIVTTTLGKRSPAP